jgi:hypothetical protein
MQFELNFQRYDHAVIKMAQDIEAPGGRRKGDQGRGVGDEDAFA